MKIKKQDINACLELNCMVEEFVFRLERFSDKYQVERNTVLNLAIYAIANKRKEV